MYENVLCVIPARAGSKGIPNKNMQKINGVPLVVFTIRQAIAAGLPIKNITVSSDCEEILSLAESWGVSPRRRPQEISGDKNSTEDALLHALETCGKDVDTVLLLQPTSPIRFRGRIKKCLEEYASGDYDSLLTTTKLYDFFWIDRSELEGIDWVSTYHPRSRPMRQNLRKEDFRYFDNGNIYITDVSVLKETKCRIGYKVCVSTITEIEGMQIDTPEDLVIFNKLLSAGRLLVTSVEDLEEVSAKL